MVWPPRRRLPQTEKTRKAHSPPDPHQPGTGLARGAIPTAATGWRVRHRNPAPTFTVRMNRPAPPVVLATPNTSPGWRGRNHQSAAQPRRRDRSHQPLPGGGAIHLGGEAAARTDAASVAIKPVAPPANPPTQAQSGLSDEGAGATRPAPTAAPEQVGLPTGVT